MQKIIVEQGGLTKELNVENNYSTNGWTAIFANVADGVRVVQKVIDLVGGTGTKPSGIINKYMGPSGLVSNIADATNIKGADGSSTDITVNNIAAIDGNITLTAGDVGADVQGAADQAQQNANEYTDQVAATKLDAADYVQHFKGKFTSLSALQEAYPTATDGDYAIIDAGTGTNARQYVWDSAEGWVDSGEVKSGTTTDQITEGSTNLYFTTNRVRDAVLTGLSLVTGTAIAAADTVLSAFGKLQKQISDLSSSLSNYLTTSSASSTYATISQAKTENFTIACSNRATAITTGTNKMSFRNVGARKLNSVRASLDTAGTATATAIDINVNGTSIFTTTLTIDATEETSVDAVTPFVFKATSHSGWSGSPNYQIDDNAKVSIDFDAVGTGAKGLDVAFLTERV